MTIEEINKEAFELINIVENISINIPKKPSELTGSSKERGFDDWSDKVVESIIERATDHLGNTTEIYLNDEGKQIGFGAVNYVRFRNLINSIYEIKLFRDFVSYGFIELESFNWIIQVYKTQKASSSLYNVLLNSFEMEVRDLTFYFPINNLEISSPFSIGNVEFVFFSEKYFDELYKTMKAKDSSVTKDGFQRVFRNDFQGRVLAKVIVKAESSKAEEIAKFNAGISTDVLKFYSDTVIIPEKKSMFDLNFRLSYQLDSNFLIEKPNESDSLSINIQFNNSPFNFTQKHYNTAYNSGLEKFSQFLLRKERNELRDVIIQSIHLFGSAISNWDLHLRCTNIITILESIFTQDSEVNNLERKTKARLSKTITNKHDEKQKIKEEFSHIYLVRHKLIHKAKRIQINPNYIKNAQMNMVNIFLNLIQINTNLGINNKTTLIERLNKIKS